MKLRNKKTGEIREFDKIGGFTLSDDYPSHYLADNTYTSLAKFNEEWEDYKPKEPLIKDERTRKAVRAWAEVNAIRKVVYVENEDSCVLSDIMGNGGYLIKFVGWIPTIKDCGEYSIAELCGEEEE